MLLATGEITLSAELVESHLAPHAEYPPETTVSVEFGRHLAGVCTGCHREDLAGGPIPGGDPSWVPARNLTPHPEGLASWTFDQFVAALRDGVRADGPPLREPMTFTQACAQHDRRGARGPLDVPAEGAAHPEPPRARRGRPSPVR